MKQLIILVGLLIPTTGALSQTFEEGEINGAAYTIIMPEDWNGGLVMYAHGYEETDQYRMEEEEEEPEEMEEIESRCGRGLPLEEDLKEERRWRALSLTR